MPAPRSCPACAASHPRLVQTLDAFEGVSVGFRVACRRCGRRGPLSPTEAEAVGRWNAQARERSPRDAAPGGERSPCAAGPPPLRRAS